MNANDDDLSFNVEKMDKWLENYFLDPLTTFYDQTHFRIDLYETDKSWIVEAQLSDYSSSEITVYVEDMKLRISGIRNTLSPKIDKQTRTRTIEFPFMVNTQKIAASFQNGILEVTISKSDKEFGKNRFITLP